MTDSRSSDLTNQPPGYLRRNHAPVCLWFWAWAMVGAAGAVGLVSGGRIALGPAALAGVAMTASACRPSINARTTCRSRAPVSVRLLHAARGTWNHVLARGDRQWVRPAPEPASLADRRPDPPRRRTSSSDSTHQLAIRSRLLLPPAKWGSKAVALVPGEAKTHQTDGPASISARQPTAIAGRVCSAR